MANYIVEFEIAGYVSMRILEITYCYMNSDNGGKIACQPYIFTSEPFVSPFIFLVLGIYTQPLTIETV